MTSVPPPHGMNEVDYEAIEAAVTETVRGRWFLAEFARRNRLTETRQLLEAMSRIEAVVAAGQGAMPSADPSIRLLIQRIKEIAGQLGDVAGDMREAGVEDHFVAAVDLQARAVAGMMRNAAPAKNALPARDMMPPIEALTSTNAKPAFAPGDKQIPADATRVPADATRVPAQMPRMPHAELPPARAPAPGPLSGASDAPPEDPRLAALSGLDSMTLAKKLALFT